MDNYPSGTVEADFGDKRPKPVRDYQENLTPREQQQICLEYLEAKELHADFEDYRSENPKPVSWIEQVKEYCEAQDGFWEWLQ